MAKGRLYTIRDWVTIGLFGALWGVMELTLGSALHAIYPPLANTFLTGVVMGGIGAAVALTGRRFVPRGGSLVLIAAVTALLKLLSPGGVTIGPVLAILAGGVLMEVILLAARRPRRWAFAVGGALAVGWNLPHKFLMMWLLYGKGFAEVYDKMVQEGSQALGLDPSAALAILAILLLVRLAVGAAGGWGAWALSGAAARRLGRDDLLTGGEGQ